MPSEPIRLEATQRTPHIDFDFQANRFVMRGESYPEDVTAFFAEPVAALESHLKGLEAGSVRFVFELIYFNSSSAKILMRLFDLLDETAARGLDVSIQWVHDEDDDSMREMGEDFSADLEHAAFEATTAEA